MPISEVYNMDCMDYMKSIPDKFFDLAIVDPPYGINVGRMNMGAGYGKDCSNIKNRKWGKNDFDKSIPPSEYFTQLFRVSSNQIIWGANYFGNMPKTRCFLIWDKGEGMYGRTFSECEYAWTSFNHGARIFKMSPVDKTRIHPTQKPVALYAWILKNYSQHGYRILDTHLGSGSSRIAAYKLGFDFYATEIDKDYFDAQEERFRRECLGEIKTPKGILKQRSLFD